MVRVARVILGVGDCFDRSGMHNVPFVFVEKHNRASSLKNYYKGEKARNYLSVGKAQYLGEHDLCIIPLLHMVAIPATIESATRLKCRNNVLLSTEGCRDQTAPFSFSLLFPLLHGIQLSRSTGDLTM